MPILNDKGQMVPPVTWREDGKCGKGYPSPVGIAESDCAKPVSAIPHLSPFDIENLTVEGMQAYRDSREEARKLNKARCCVNNECMYDLKC
jgi:hypothetical protein